MARRNTGTPAPMPAGHAAPRSPGVRGAGCGRGPTLRVAGRASSRSPPYFCFSLLLPKAAFDSVPAQPGKVGLLFCATGPQLLDRLTLPDRLALQGGHLPVPCRRRLQVLLQPKDFLAQRHHRRAPRRLNTSLLEKRFQALHLRLEEQALLRVPADLLHLPMRGFKLSPGAGEIPLQHPCTGAGGGLRPGQLPDTCLRRIRTDPLPLVQRPPVRRLAGHNRGRQTQSVVPSSQRPCRPMCLVASHHAHDHKRGEIPLPAICWHFIGGPELDWNHPSPRGRTLTSTPTRNLACVLFITYRLLSNISTVRANENAGLPGQGVQCGAPCR